MRDLLYCKPASNSKEKQMFEILIKTHIIEKGITMPNRRYGFGYDRIRKLMRLCGSYIDKYGYNNVEIQSAIDDLFEYQKIHKDVDFKLPDDICKGIDNLLTYRISCEDSVNYHDITSEDLFHKYGSFTEFAMSRHTCRFFSNKDIDKSLLESAIQTAIKAPSACNRQSTRVKIFSTDENKQFILNIQTGNRGFGQNAKMILMITSVQSAWEYMFRTSAYLDAGLFTMNLLYALHEKKIATCVLNAHLIPKKIKQLHKKGFLSKEEIPIVFIAIGIPPEKFDIARSSRLKINDIIQYIN